ncbi:Major facilitator superfamily protein isoform 1 [Gossypium australe]|uniref:Major facilitator superfamily protein isoform 1 n=1 Tax=Gossypium australe TaxID=47621 RepID=A0A5B6W6I7_9ROSI|nr:Major facilitator superfamily protein isoform 1 [Gossypium australe]
MRSNTPSLAPGFTLFPSLKPPHTTLFFHQIFVLILTFLAYASFHASRKPPSIVKSVLGPTVQTNSTSNDTGWAPFNGPEGTHRLGELDLAFLTSYAIGMYFAGHVGDRIDLRLFLVFGMMGSGILTIIFGFGYWFDVHLLGYFIGVQVICGVFQSIGWPCVVSVVGNWFGKEKRGLIMGVWTSHTSVGNIIGSVVASGVLEFGWGWSFLVPGILIILVGILVFCFLVVSPDDLGLEMMASGKEIEMNVGEENVANLEKAESEEAGLLENKDSDSLAAIGFLEAWRLPGVAPFSFCLFFSKLVAYTFLYWLPFYIRHTAVAGVHLSHKTAGILSTIFDIGGVLGGVLAGFISDVIDARAVTSVTFLLLSIPALILYRIYGSVSMVTNIGLMFLSGLLVNGPYSLITTAVAADLGTQDLIKGNSRALATVTAIIDGTGSVGAALGPLLAGYISTRGWNSVFLMLIFAIFFASIFLVRVAKTEIGMMVSEGKELGSSVTAS